MRRSGVERDLGNTIRGTAKRAVRRALSDVFQRMSCVQRRAALVSEVLPRHLGAVDLPFV